MPMQHAVLLTHVMCSGAPCAVYRLLDQPGLETASDAIVSLACDELERDVWREVALLGE
jgi:hypothetical protein